MYEVRIYCKPADCNILVPPYVIYNETDVTYLHRILEWVTVNRKRANLLLWRMTFRALNSKTW